MFKKAGIKAREREKGENRENRHNCNQNGKTSQRAALSTKNQNGEVERLEAKQFFLSSSFSGAIQFK